MCRTTSWWRNTRTNVTYGAHCLLVRHSFLPPQNNEPLEGLIEHGAHANSLSPSRRFGSDVLFEYHVNQALGVRRHRRIDNDSRADLE